MPVQRFPLVGSLTTRKPGPNISELTTDQVFVNCYPEVIKNPITGKGTVILNKRMGFIEAINSVQSSATGSYGFVNWTTRASGSQQTLSFLKSTGSSIMFFIGSGQIGSDVASTDSCLYMDETKISGTANLTATLKDSSTAALEAWFFPEGGAWTQITDADFPTDICAEHAHMDGFMFVMTTSGKIYNSDVNSLSAWTSTSFIPANTLGERGGGLARYNKFIVAFSDYCTDFFVNNGNATGSVLSRVDGATIRIGIVRRVNTVGRTSMPVGNTVYWLGRDLESGNAGVYRLKGMSAEKVSNGLIDRLMARNVITFIAGAFTQLGMTHIAFGAAGDATKFCYCVELNLWWEYTTGNSAAFTAFVGGYGAFAAESFMAASGSSKIWVTDATNAPTWQDDGSNYTMTVRTQNIDVGTRRRKFWESLSLIGDDTLAASNVGVSFSDNDFASFSTARNIDMNTYPPTKLTRLGSSRRRSWQFTNTAATPLRLEAVEIEYDVGQN